MNTRIHLSFVIFLLSFFFILFSCQKDPTALDNAQFELKAEYVEVTEAWLRLSTDTISKNTVYLVKRDTHIVFEGKLDKPDTLLHDTGLEPATDYEYKVNVNKQIKKSLNLQITTMDTTKYNFDVSTFKIGNALFNDCRIWDNDNFWVIGEYTKRDTFGNRLGPFTILSYENGGWVDIEVKEKQSSLPSIESIWAINKKAVWFVIYDIWYWTGGAVRRIWDEGKIHKIFGYDSDEIYAGGSKGNLLLLNNNSISRISISENYNVRDIWGNSNRQTIIGVSDISNRDQRLLFLEKGNILEDKKLLFDEFVSSLWFKNISKIFIGGKNVNILNRNNTYTRYEIETTSFITKIRGTDINNVFLIAYGGEVFHFNGKTWKKLCQVPASLNGLYVTNNMVIAVGSNMFDGYIIKIDY